MAHEWDEITENTVAPDGNTVKENKIITKAFSIFADSIGVYKNWLFYMTDKDFDKEIELRNKIGTIMLGSLFDILSYEKKIEKFKEEARNNGLEHLNSYFNLISEYISSVKDFLSIYTKEEQLFITYQRNQFAHSFLNGRLNDEIGVKYLSGGEFIEEKITTTELHKIMQEIYSSKHIDKTLKNIIDKWFEHKSKYTSFILGFIKHEKKIYELIYKKVPISVSFHD